MEEARSVRTLGGGESREGGAPWVGEDDVATSCEDPNWPFWLVGEC